MDAKELYNQFKSKIQVNYDDHEAASITRLVLEHFGIQQLDIALGNPISTLPKELESIASRLLKNEPVQYVLGYTWFYGRKFLVNKHTLIPRPETEELCQHVLNTLPSSQPIKLLDIGTGSGCIPITLKLEHPSLEVTTMDISRQALIKARENADQHSASIEFIEQDILSTDALKPYHVLVSNPPYVTQTDKQLMKEHVLSFEPHSALFVEDHNPLVFYEKICALASKMNEKPLIFFEINERFGKEVSELLRNTGYPSVYIVKDLQNKDRIVVGKS